MENREEPREEEILDAMPEDAAEQEEAEAEIMEEPAEEEEASVEDQLDAAQEQYLRLYAEFENFRKRTAKEKMETFGDATARCVEQLLPIVDNFERAMDAPCSDEQYHHGMMMIFTQLKAFLEKLGVTEIQALGAEFNPNIHQAIKQSEATEEFPENTVCEVFQKGYQLKERLIRPAMVAVAN